MEQQAVQLHSAGATVRHKSPFANLPTPANETPLSQDIIEQWVAPFYIKRLEVENSDFLEASAVVTSDFVLTLLGEFNWRPRTVGAQFIAVRQFYELQQPLSNLLLRSEVCYAGDTYCLALASLGNVAATDTLCAYLDYYLRQRNLWFDQASAMAALLYLDEKLESNKATQFSKSWQRFIRNKPNWNLDKSTQAFRKEMAVVEQMRTRVLNTK